MSIHHQDVSTFIIQALPNQIMILTRYLNFNVLYQKVQMSMYLLWHWNWFYTKFLVAFMKLSISVSLSLSRSMSKVFIDIFLFVSELWNHKNEHWKERSLNFWCNVKWNKICNVHRNATAKNAEQWADRTLVLWVFLADILCFCIFFFFSLFFLVSSLYLLRVHVV